MATPAPIRTNLRAPNVFAVTAEAWAGARAVRLRRKNCGT
jgi:hypothetical protein